MPTWLKYAAAGIITGLLLFMVGEVLRPHGDDLAIDHGLDALVQWEPAEAALFECLIDSIAKDPDLFHVGERFEVVPPSDEQGSLVLKSTMSTRQFEIVERAIVMRGFLEPRIVFLDCDIWK